MLYPPIDPAAERRARRLLRILAFWGLLVFGRLIYLQYFRHEHYATLADGQQIHRVEIPAHRGTVIDRTGHILAITVPTEKVVVDPARLPDIPTAAAILSGVLGLDPEQLEIDLRKRAARKSGRSYFVVAQKVTQEQAQRLRSLGLKWLYFESGSQRVYPNEGLAAHVLGGVDSSMHGNAGIEQGMEDELAGYSGYANMVADVSNRGFDSQVEAEPVPGKDVALTLDHRIQYDLEDQLAKAVQENSCKSGRGVVMDPNTGEILALASYPTYNPNEKVVDPEARRNLAVQSAVEPGSVFKVFTISGAIEDKLLTPLNGFHCGNGRLNLFGRVIHDAHPYGYLTVEDILAKSSNIGAIQVALTLKEKRFFEYIKLFGFGDRTGLPLPGESPGRVIRLNRWTKSSIGSVAMGHEIMTTTVQLAQAVSVIANGGRLVRPRLVQKVSPNPLSPYQLQKVSYDIPVPEAKSVIGPSTVVTMRNMMDRVVISGTGKGAKIPGYSSGGKTGSAQMYDPKAGVYTHRYHASFMGFAPVTNPRVVVVITLDGSSKFGGVVAAPVFREVAGSALRILNVPPDLPIVEKPEPVPVTPLNDVAFADLTSEKPVENVDNSEVTDVKATLITPDFSGKSLREVLAEASRRGFRIEPDGSGLVRAQSPAPGSPVVYGQKIRLRLGR